MNVFALHQQPQVAALWLDDLRRNKMILETAQILSTVLHQTGWYHLSESLYQPTHENHPVIGWAKILDNFDWLVAYGEALAEQRYQATGKDHASHMVILTAKKIREKHCPKYDTPFTVRMRDVEFHNCARRKDMNLDFTHFEDTIMAYRAYIAVRWYHDKEPPTWKHGLKPPWYKTV